MTAIDEALNRLVKVTKTGIEAYEAIPWWSIKERFIAKGSLATLNIVLELLHQLKHKYDNHNGRFN